MGRTFRFTSGDVQMLELLERLGYWLKASDIFDSVRPSQHKWMPRSAQWVVWHPVAWQLRCQPLPAAYPLCTAGVVAVLPPAFQGLFFVDKKSAVGIPVMAWLLARMQPQSPRTRACNLSKAYDLRRDQPALANWLKDRAVAAGAALPKDWNKLRKQRRL
jgi:hypothetical protein